MRFHQSSFTLFAFAVFSSSGIGGIIFGPVQGKAGQSIRLVTFSETTNGTVERTGIGTPRNGTMEVKRERELIWTFRTPTEDGMRRGMVRVAKINTHAKTVIGGEDEKIDDKSPLNGKMFAMSKSTNGDWNFELDGSVPLVRVEKEINELKVYLQRDWYPKHEVNLGDSWEFNPTWIRMIIERDLSRAQTMATMRLRQIRNTRDLRVAVIDINIRSTGTDYRPDGSESDGSLTLTGELTVNLNTMLDETLDLKGTIVSTYIKGAETTKVKLPIHMVANKSFVNDDWMP